jgi:hypothetical protein
LQLFLCWVIYILAVKLPHITFNPHYIKVTKEQWKNNIKFNASFSWQILPFARTFGILKKNNIFDWSLLRLFSDGTPLDIPIVGKGQEKTVKARGGSFS